MYIENTPIERLNEIQSILDKRRRLSFEGLDPSQTEGKSHKEGLKYLIRQNYKRNTVIGVNVTRKQCAATARRSAGDMYRLMKTYYPKITFAKTRQLLIELINEGYISSNYCTDIRKRVYWSPRIMYGWWDFNGGVIRNPEEPDEFECSIAWQK